MRPITLPAFAPYLSDLIGLVLSAGLVVGYLAYLRWRTTRHDPLYTVQAVNAEARRLWVESVMRERRDLLAVQTLRNSTMAATFLASTSVLLVIGALSLSGRGNELEHALHSLNVIGAIDPSLWQAKVLVLVVDLCVGFFSFALAVRRFHHAGYLINVPVEPPHPTITPRYVTEYLNGAARHYSTGMRAYYFTVPLLFWLFGPHLMVPATVVMVLVLYRLDRAPDAGG
jgi:uncharacterized membrane protein